MPKTADGIAAMLVDADTNLHANGGALATKYNVGAPALLRIHQARLVWQWFIDALNVGRHWSQSLTTVRDTLLTGATATPVPLPPGPELPDLPALAAGPPVVPALLEPGFFTFFSSVVSQIKTAANYDPADGTLLGIEGAAVAPPDPATLPVLTGDLYSSGHPELTCMKGQFQGFTVWLTRPGQAKKMIGFSTTRRFVVEEPLPALGTAEIWTFEVQYRYQNKPFGQVSQALNLTVRG